MLRKKFIFTECFDCGEEIKHSILALVKADTKDDNKILPTDFMIIECEGCGEISFLMREYLGRNLPSKKFLDSRYPKEEIYEFLNDNDLENLPSKIYDLYEEVRQAFLTDSNITVSLGLRTLIEAICIQKNISGKNLFEKIINLQKQGMISGMELETLNKLRLLGNSSAHQIKNYNLEKLNYGLEVVNHVLRSMYVLPKINKKLKS